MNFIRTYALLIIYLSGRACGLLKASECGQVKVELSWSRVDTIMLVSVQTLILAFQLPSELWKPSDNSQNDKDSCFLTHTVHSINPYWMNKWMICLIYQDEASASFSLVSSLPPLPQEKVWNNKASSCAWTWIH